MYLKQEQQKYQPRFEYKNNNFLFSLLFIKPTQSHPLSVSLFLSHIAQSQPSSFPFSLSLSRSQPWPKVIHLLYLILPNPHPRQIRERRKQRRLREEVVLVSSLRLISFGFDSFESEVASGLVLTLRFGSEVCDWFFKK